MRDLSQAEAEAWARARCRGLSARGLLSGELLERAHHRALRDREKEGVRERMFLLEPRHQHRLPWRGLLGAGVASDQDRDQGCEASRSWQAAAEDS